MQGEPGAPGVGDPYFPGLGNGGYDVEHYTLDLTWRADEGVLDGVATIEAGRHPGPERLQPRPGRAGGAVGDGRRRAGRTTDRGRSRARRSPRRRPSPTATTSRPSSPTAASPSRSARAPTCSTSAGRPTAARRSWCPSRRAQPRSSRSTTTPPTRPPTRSASPPPRTRWWRPTACSSPRTTRATARRSWTYEAGDPMASYLVQIAIGDYELVDGGEVDGVMVRHAFHRSLADAARVTTERTGRDDRAARRHLRAVPVRGLRRAGGRRGPRLRPRDADPHDHRLRHRAPGTRRRHHPPARAGPPVGRRRGEPGDVEGHLAERGLRHLRRVALHRAHRAAARPADIARQYEGAAELDLPPGDPGLGRAVQRHRVHPRRHDAAGPARAGRRRRLLRDPAHLDRRAPRRAPRRPRTSSPWPSAISRRASSTTCSRPGSTPTSCPTC